MLANKYGFHHILPENVSVPAIEQYGQYVATLRLRDGDAGSGASAGGSEESVQLRVEVGGPLAKRVKVEKSKSASGESKSEKKARFTSRSAAGGKGGDKGGAADKAGKKR